MDVVLQEIDVETRDVLFEWHSLDHVPPSASYQVQPSGRGTWDYFHGNSIDPPVARRGTIVVSARNTSAVYGIDRGTGAVRWTLGGKQDEFGLVRYRPFLQFCAQHDARRQPNGDITIFDNGGPALGNMLDCPIHMARVLRFRLDSGAAEGAPDPDDPRPSRRPRTAPATTVWPMGNARRQGNGDLLISWGTTGRLTRVTPSGRVTLGSTWSATPTAPSGGPGPAGRPAGRQSRHGAASDAWSRSGRAGTARRRSAAGVCSPAGAPDELAGLETFPFRGLETKMRIATGARYVAVVALDASGAPLGRSEVVRTS